MRSSGTAGTGSRSRLNRDLVLSAAIALADKAGIESLTMRRLGEDLGVEAMSLYNHVANKEDLFHGMVDAVFTEIELPSHNDDWKTAMRKRSISFRAVLSRHPLGHGTAGLGDESRPGHSAAP